MTAIDTVNAGNHAGTAQPSVGRLDVSRAGSAHVSRHLLSQVVRFGLVGVSGLFVGLAVLNAVMWLTGHFVLANLVAFVFAVSWNFAPQSEAYLRWQWPIVAPTVGGIRTRFAWGQRRELVRRLFAVLRPNVFSRTLQRDSLAGRGDISGRETFYGRESWCFVRQRRAPTCNLNKWRCPWNVTRWSMSKQEGRIPLPTLLQSVWLSRYLPVVRI